MSALKKLSDAEIDSALAEAEGWSVSENRMAIHKSFRFKNFRTAWSFMEDVAIEADEMSHHPEWTNVYSRVDITLTTHDVKGLSDLDFELAAIIDDIAASPDIQTD